MNLYFLLLAVFVAAAEKVNQIFPFEVSVKIVSCFLLFQTSFTTRFTGLKCIANETFVSFARFQLKSVRGGMGSLNFWFTPRKEMNDIWLDFTLFFKFGTIYRQWLFHYDFDICDTVGIDRSSKNFLMTLLRTFWKENNLNFKCPIKSSYNISINADNSTYNTLFDKLPRMPQGEYKTGSRVHTKKNDTILYCELKFEVKSKSGVDRMSMLEMG